MGCLRTENQITRQHPTPDGSRNFRWRPKLLAKQRCHSNSSKCRQLEPSLATNQQLQLSLKWLKASRLTLSTWELHQQLTRRQRWNLSQYNKHKCKALASQLQLLPRTPCNWERKSTIYSKSRPPVVVVVWLLPASKTMVLSNRSTRRSLILTSVGMISSIPSSQPKRKRQTFSAMGTVVRRSRATSCRKSIVYGETISIIRTLVVAALTRCR